MSWWCRLRVITRSDSKHSIVKLTMFFKPWLTNLLCLFPFSKNFRKIPKDQLHVGIFDDDFISMPILFLSNCFEQILVYSNSINRESLSYSSVNVNLFLFHKTSVFVYQLMYCIFQRTIQPNLLSLNSQQQQPQSPQQQHRRHPNTPVFKAWFTSVSHYEEDGHPGSLLTWVWWGTCVTASDIVVMTRHVT